MTVFGEYAGYYDLLYKDKNYEVESAYIHRLIQKYAPKAKTVLNMGCGSGRHDRYLESLGYGVTGVDMSEQMLSVAKASAGSGTSPEYILGDIRCLNLQKDFDVVIALFHVISYQTTNQDLKDAFESAYRHLKPGGVFVFDFWYGPAVLTDRPTVRVKEMEDSAVSVTRIATPVMHPSRNVVDVLYHIFLCDKASGRVQELRETHTMRYLFVPEIQLMLVQAGFTSPYFEEWLTSNPLGFSSWNATVVTCRLTPDQYGTKSCE